MPCRFYRAASRVSPHYHGRRVFPAADLRPMLAIATEVEPPLDDPRLVYEPDRRNRAMCRSIRAAAPRCARSWSRNGNEKCGSFPNWSRRLPPGPASLDGPGGGRRWRSSPSTPWTSRPASSACRAGSTCRCGLSLVGPGAVPGRAATALMIFDLLRDGDVDWRLRRCSSGASRSRSGSPTSARRCSA